MKKKNTNITNYLHDYVNLIPSKYLIPLNLYKKYFLIN